MSAISAANGQVQDRPGGQEGQRFAEVPMPGLGWFFRTPFSRDWLFWAGVACAVSSLVGDGSYLTLMFSMLVPYWTLGALVSRRRRQGHPPVQRLRSRGWGLDAWCGAFTAFVVVYAVLVGISWLVYPLTFA